MYKTKKLYAQQLISNLYPSPTDDKKLEEQEAMLVVSQARDAIIKKYLYSNYTEDRRPFGNWLSLDEGLEVQHDKSRGVYFIELNYKPISFIADSGIQHVWAGKNEDDFLQPVRAGFNWLTKGRFSGLITKGFYLEGGKLIFVQSMKDSAPISVRLIADSSSLGENDLFPIDGSVETEFMQLAIQFASTQKQFPQDTTSDNISQ